MNLCIVLPLMQKKFFSAQVMAIGIFYFYFRGFVGRKDFVQNSHYVCSRLAKLPRFTQFLMPFLKSLNPRIFN